MMGAREQALESALERCRTVLSNMALENTGITSFANRWPVHHEPLRADAKNLLPIIDAALAAPSASTQEPVACKLVPVEPTHEMLSAGDSQMPQFSEDDKHLTGYDVCKDIWRDMLSAAPAHGRVSDAEVEAFGQAWYGELWPHSVPHNTKTEIRRGLEAARGVVLAQGGVDVSEDFVKAVWLALPRGDVREEHVAAALRRALDKEEAGRG